MNDGAPGLWEVLGNSTPHPFWILVLLAAAGLYAWAFARDRREARGRPHPAWKLAAFMAGLFMVALATVSPVEAYGNEILWVNFLGFLLLTMCAAPLILLGSPLTLAFRVAGPGGRSRLRGFYRSKAMAAVTFPIVSWLAFAALTYIWQFTRLTDEAAERTIVRDVENVSLLLVSLCFWTPVLCADPVRWRMAYPLRALYVFLEATHKGLFGGMFLSMSRPFHNGFAERLPSWTNLTAIDDQRIGIAILWVAGNIIFVAALAGVLVRWMQYERRNSHRVDWHLRLAREAEGRRKAALEQVFRKTV